jgi:toxin ParE1/3/4
MNVRWTPPALEALAGIHKHIATENPAAADMLRDRALAYAETTLAIQPMTGRPGRVHGTREGVIHPSYIMVYRVTRGAVEILTIRHAARRWPRNF